MQMLTSSKALHDELTNVVRSSILHGFVLAVTGQIVELQTVEISN